MCAKVWVVSQKAVLRASGKVPNRMSMELETNIVSVNVAGAVLVTDRNTGAANTLEMVAFVTALTAITATDRVALSAL